MSSLIRVSVTFLTFLSCGSYGGAFGSLFPDWRTPTTLWCLSSRYEGGLLSEFRAVWRVKVKQRRFFFKLPIFQSVKVWTRVSFVVVKMQITQRARRWCTSWRWRPWLVPYYRGEAAFPKHHRSIVSVVTGPSCFSVSHPDKLFFPPPNWSLSQSLREEQDIGPELQQIYEVVWIFVVAAGRSVCRWRSNKSIFPHNHFFQLVNNGPSAFSQATLEVRCPLRAQGHPLLYPVEVITKGPISCSSKNLNAMKLKVRTPRHASEAGKACRDASVNLSARVFTPAAPPWSSRWSHISEIQTWASHPQKRAALWDPRSAWKPGEKEGILVSENEILQRSASLNASGCSCDAQNRAIVLEAALSSELAKDWNDNEISVEEIDHQ